MILLYYLSLTHYLWQISKMIFTTHNLLLASNVWATIDDRVAFGKVINTVWTGKFSVDLNKKIFRARSLTLSLFDLLCHFWIRSRHKPNMDRSLLLWACWLLHLLEEQKQLFVKCWFPVSTHAPTHGRQNHWDLIGNRSFRAIGHVRISWVPKSQSWCGLEFFKVMTHPT